MEESKMEKKKIIVPFETVYGEGFQAQMRELDEELAEMDFYWEQSDLLSISPNEWIYQLQDSEGEIIKEVEIWLDENNQMIAELR